MEWCHCPHGPGRARSGRVSGTIRYGKLIVAEGGESSGDVKRLDAADEPQRSLLPGCMDKPRTSSPRNSFRRGWTSCQSRA